MVQDTTSLNLTANDSIAELGPIDSGGLARGLLLHTTLAVNPSGDRPGGLGAAVLGPPPAGAARGPRRRRAASGSRASIRPAGPSTRRAPAAPAIGPHHGPRGGRLRRDPVGRRRGRRRDHPLRPGPSRRGAAADRPRRGPRPAGPGQQMDGRPPVARPAPPATPGSRCGCWRPS